MIKNNEYMNLRKGNKYYLTSYITPKNKKYINIIFNKDIDLSVYNNLTHLYFDDNLNQEIDLSKNIKLEYLEFGWNFNNEINLLNNINLKYLIFGWDFNQIINLSNNNNLICLEINGDYDKNITIPKSVEKLKLNCCDNQYIIDNLSNNIKELHILSCYSLNLL